MSQQNDAKKMHEPSICKIVIKACITIFVISCFIYITTFLIQFLAENFYDAADETGVIRHCDTYFYEKDYLSLYNELYSNQAYDEKYDMYWEAANGYMDYSQYVQYQKAVEKGNKDSEIYLEKYKEKVLENKRECRFEQNKEQLESYAKLVNE